MRRLKRSVISSRTQSLRMSFWMEGMPLAPEHKYNMVYRVTLKNGKQYALDIIGAQQGWKEAIMPWNKYSL